MATATVQIDDLPQDTRMTLVNTEFLSEYGGRIPAGTVLLVDKATARRWQQRGIAVPSEETDKTLAEQKRAHLERLQDEIRMLESGEATISAPPEREVVRASKLAASGRPSRGRR